jgi:hypothetical protein
MALSPVLGRTARSFLRNETAAIDRDTRPPPRETHFQDRREINGAQVDRAHDEGLKF